MKLLLALAAVSALVVAGPAPAQPKLVESGMRVDKIKDGLFVVRGPFRLCGTRGCGRRGAVDDGMLHEPGDVAVRVTPEGLILVDNKYPEDVPGLLEQVKTISPLPIRYMLNSHQHADHIGGDGEIKKRGIEIVAQRNLRNGYAKTDPAGAPNVTFQDQGSIYLGGVEVKMYHFGPAHTDGDTFVYFPDLKVVHTGDVIIDGMPIADLDAGGSWEAYPDAIRQVLKLDWDLAIPGHGNYMTRAQVVKYLADTETLNNRMKDLVRRRVPKTELKTALKLDDLGWANSVSTVNFWTKAAAYYDEMAAVVAREQTRKR